MGKNNRCYLQNVQVDFQLCPGSQVKHHSFHPAPGGPPARSDLSLLWFFSQSPVLLTGHWAFCFALWALCLLATVSEFSPRWVLSPSAPQKGLYTVPHIIVHRGGYPGEREIKPGSHSGFPKAWTFHDLLCRCPDRLTCHLNAQQETPSEDPQFFIKWK